MKKVSKPGFLVGVMLKALAVLLFLPALHAQTVSPDQIRSAASRSLAIVQSGSVGFYRSVVCFSCHDHALPMLAFRLARKRGVPVDETAASQVAAKGLLAMPDLSSIDRAVWRCRDREDSARRRCGPER